jgi:recombination associated protein RdgC
MPKSRRAAILTGWIAGEPLPEGLAWAKSANCGCHRRRRGGQVPAPGAALRRDRQAPGRRQAGDQAGADFEDNLSFVLGDDLSCAS